eukprot:CAMPEP_0197525206 /NCGR_PEP_ID=MMETSP1318-20131121/10683_1 /TAXON_ID=552666 /ORGANISM="Partenskyella glossopodia, Strain RCC365" /LENGTH=369 /DNA_ID=CAMNT_0043078395 /DNA_START=165 /DNA_END=1275 /DNA_ORIENTATION=-
MVSRHDITCCFCSRADYCGSNQDVMDESHVLLTRVPLSDPDLCHQLYGNFGGNLPNVLSDSAQADSEELLRQICTDCCLDLRRPQLYESGARPSVGVGSAGFERRDAAAVILFEFLMFQKVRSFYVYLPFLPLLAGTVLTTIGSDSHRSSPDGVIYMLVAIVSGALKAITTHEFLVGLRHQVGVLSFLFWIDLAMLLLLLPAAAVFSEYQHIQTWDRLYQVVPWIIVIANGLFGGVRAWLVKVVLKYNTALTKVVCDIIIKAATIGLSIVVFGTVLPKIMVAGICLTIFGFTMYSAAAFYEKVYGCESQTPPKDSRASHTKSLEGVHVSSPTESYITSSDQSIRLEDEDSDDEKPLLYKTTAAAARGKC